MLGCEIAPICKFDRKNYFYPDMPKNYQITQYDLPLCANGSVPLHDLAYPKDAQKSIATPDKEVQLVRIHLEEDVAKSFHFETSTGIDFNRAGTPLMEIVTRTGDQLTGGSVRVSHRAQANPDLRRRERCGHGERAAALRLQRFGAAGSAEGARREDRDQEHELDQRRAARAGVRDRAARSRHWSAAKSFNRKRAAGMMTRGETFLMRTKEFAHDYRYFPDPDLLPVKSEALLAEARERLPELPTAKRARFVEQYEVSPYDAGVLASDLELARYFETAAKGAQKPKSVANWILNDLQSALSDAGKVIGDCPIPPQALDELVNLIESGKISGKQGKEVFAEMFASGKGAAAIVKEKGIEQVSDAGAIEQLCDQVIAANPKPAADFRAGNAASLNFLKGQVMKLSQGKANPALAGEILERKLK